MLIITKDFNLYNIEMWASVSSFLIILLFISSTEAFYVVADGGYCATYKSTLPGTLITFEKCELWNPRHYSWKLFFTGSAPTDPVLMCVGDTNVCDQVGDDGREYLGKKDLTNVAQHWSAISGNRFTNGLTGPNFCSTTMYNPDGDDMPDYGQMLPCSDTVDQMSLSFVSTRSLARHFYSNQHSDMLNVDSFLLSYPKPTVPYYYHF